MDIGSVYSDYLASTVTASSNLERTLNGNHTEKSEDELLDVCKQFEAYFYEQIFKNMQKAMVPSDESDANHTMIGYYKDNLISEYSKSIVKQSGDNSLAMQLYEQMKRNYSIGEDVVDPTKKVTEAEKVEEVSESKEATAQK